VGRILIRQWSFRLYLEIDAGREGKVTEIVKKMDTTSSGNLYRSMPRPKNTPMKNWCMPIILLFALQTADAQLGLTVAPTSSLSPQWQILVENFVTEKRTDFLEYGATGLVDYHLPLQNKAWSIRPTVHGMSASFSYEDYHFDVYMIGFQPNMNFELFAGGESNKNGIRPFLQFSPGIDYSHKKFLRPVVDNGQFTGSHQNFTDKSWDFSLGFNLLAEIKLTSLLSIAPQIGIRYFPSITWAGFTEQVSYGQITDQFDETDWRQITVGMRIGLDLENGTRQQ
jgi:hypothetical protein